MERPCGEKEFLRLFFFVRNDDEEEPSRDDGHTLKKKSWREDCETEAEDCETEGRDCFILLFDCSHEARERERETIRKRERASERSKKGKSKRREKLFLMRKIIFFWITRGGFARSTGEFLVQSLTLIV
jgi:hypothetical protein